MKILTESVKMPLKILEKRSGNPQKSSEILRGFLVWKSFVNEIYKYLPLALREHFLDFFWKFFLDILDLCEKVFQEIQEKFSRNSRKTENIRKNFLKATALILLKKIFCRYCSIIFSKRFSKTILITLNNRKAVFIQNSIKFFLARSARVLTTFILSN